MEMNRRTPRSQFVRDQQGSLCFVEITDIGQRGTEIAPVFGALRRQANRDSKLFDGQTDRSAAVERSTECVVFGRGQFGCSFASHLFEHQYNESRQDQSAADQYSFRDRLTEQNERKNEGHNYTGLVYAGHPGDKAFLHCSIVKNPA